MRIVTGGSHDDAGEDGIVILLHQTSIDRNPDKGGQYRGLRDLSIVQGPRTLSKDLEYSCASNPLASRTRREILSGASGTTGYAVSSARPRLKPRIPEV